MKATTPIAADAMRLMSMMFAIRLRCSSVFLSVSSCLLSVFHPQSLASILVYCEYTFRFFSDLYGLVLRHPMKSDTILDPMERYHQERLRTSILSN